MFESNETFSSLAKPSLLNKIHTKIENNDPYYTDIDLGNEYEYERSNKQQ